MVHHTDNLIQMDETSIYGLSSVKQNPIYFVIRVSSGAHARFVHPDENGELKNKTVQYLLSSNIVRLARKLLSFPHWLSDPLFNSNDLLKF